MKDIIQKVETKITFTFGNGETYDLPLKNNNNTELKNYCTSIKLNESIYARSSNNIVGNITGNTLSIDLVSYDKLLLPNNEDSKFYGYMNDTAYIDISCYIVDEDVNVCMGRYFVDTWECGNSSQKNNEVYISCVDLLSKIKNISLDKIRLKRNMSFNEYLKIIIDSINKLVPNYMKILYTEDDLNIWKNSDYAWQVYFNNIDREDVESIFNSIANYAISYIWIDRNMHIKTDHLLDDKYSEAVCNISGQFNLLEYGTQTGDIDKYSGIKVKYIESITNEDKMLLSLNNVQLYKGINKIYDQTMNSDNVYDIHTIEIKTDNGLAYTTSFNNYKNKIDLNIYSTSKSLASINIYGSVINEYYNTYEKYINDSNKNNVANINNRLLIRELIPTYADGLIGLMSMKNSQLYASGFINPQVKCGDIVHVYGAKMGINDYYKVIGLEFTLGTNYNCKVNLIKTVNIERNVDDILFVHNSYLLDVLSDLSVEQNRYNDISISDNDICERNLKNELALLRAQL